MSLHGKSFDELTANERSRFLLEDPRGYAEAVDAWETQQIQQLIKAQNRALLQRAVRFLLRWSVPSRGSRLKES